MIVQTSGSIQSLSAAPFGLNFPRMTRGLLDYSGRYQTYAELYRVQPNIRLVVRFLGRNIGSLDLAAFRAGPDEERTRLPDSHDLARFLKNPNPHTTRHRWVRSIVEDLAIYDDFFALKTRNEISGKMSALRIPPQNIRPVPNPETGETSWLWAEFWEIFGSRGSKVVHDDELIHIHGHNPDDPRMGVSPLEALRRILAEEAASGEWREQYWRGAARMSGYISRPPNQKWSIEARDRFRDGWVDAYTGNGGKAGQTPILEDGMEFHEAAFSAVESEYLGSRKLSREEVAAQYFIPSAFVGVLDNANFSNIEEQHISLYSDTFGPTLDEIEEEYELQVLPDFSGVEGVYVAFDLEKKLQGSFEKQAIAASTATGAPWLTRDEQRRKFNLPPLPDGAGAEIVTPLNVLIGGLASPRDTAPPPPGAPPPAPPGPGEPPPEPPPTSGQAARAAAARKTRTESTRRELRKWDPQHRAVIEDFFFRQSSSVLAAIGAGKSVAEAFAGNDAGRWDRELGVDLLRVASAMNEDIGQLSADRFGGVYDTTRAARWLELNATIGAQGINRTTIGAVGRAVLGTKARGRKLTTAEISAELGADDPYDLDFEDLSDETLDNGMPDAVTAARNVFDLALAGRAVQIASSRSTTVGNFSLHDGAAQAGARSKNWIVTSSDSRHPEMDGESVPMGESFSNGADWPGDSANLDVSETAGCECVLDFGT